LTRYWWRESLGRDYARSLRVGLIYEERTPAGQHLQIFHHSWWGRLVVLDGIVQFTERDEFIYHEVLVYTPVAVLSEPPRRVLIVGGGDGGALRELQKFPELEAVVQAEIDLAVFQACQKYFPELSGNYDDPRVEFRVEDGLAAVTRLPEGSFDLVIVDCTDPVGPAQSLYTPEFYAGVHRVLRPGGVFIQQASLPGLFPEILQKAYHLARKVFPSLQVLRTMVPCYGDEIAFLLGSTRYEEDFLPQRKIRGRHYSPEMHRASLVLPAWWQELLKTPSSLLRE